MKNFGKILRSIIESRNISAKDVCEATGIPRSTLSEWMNGRTPIMDKSIVSLASYLGVSIEYLITGGTLSDEDIVQQLIEDRFITLHKGTYRITIDKVLKE